MDWYNFHRFGFVCLTELPFEYSHYHRAKYGNFGIAFKRQWAIQRFQPVMYIPRVGAIYLHVANLLNHYRNDLDRKFLKEWIVGKNNVVIAPMSDDLRKEHDTARKEFFFKAHKGLLADRPIKTLLNYVEYDDLRHEMEWRSIAELFHYESENKQEQLKVATETTSSESHCWLHVLKNEPPHPQDPYGLSQTGRISVFSTDDISHILCPKPFY